MYREIADFIEDWTYESDATIKIFKAIPEDKKSIKFNEQVRSLEKLAWHITQTLTEMPYKAGLLEEDGLENQPVPNSIAEIISIYKEKCDLICKTAKKKWSDEDLEDEINMYGFNWTKGKVLSILIRHQIHHRAQMTVLLRQAGVKVPGIYGPAKEEWAEYGLPTME